MTDIKSEQSYIAVLLEQADSEVLDRLDAIGEFSITEENLTQIRSRPLREGAPLSERVTRADHLASGSPDDHPVPLRIHRPRGTDAPLPCIYSIHGGGYMIGANTGDDSLFDTWCTDLQCVGVSVDYRLAPEHPYPTPLEDCYTGVRWVHDNADDLGIDPTRIGLIGGSAGGGLAAALALLVRDRGELNLIFQVLRYPMLDDRQTTTSSQAPTPLWNPPTNRFGWISYLGSLYGTDGVPAYAAPARATDLSRLPPTFITVGNLDMLLDEDIAYARALIAAGVPTDLHVLAGAPHAFDSMVGDTAVARRGRHALDSWIAAQLRPLPTGRLAA